MIADAVAMAGLGISLEARQSDPPVSREQGPELLDVVGARGQDIPRVQDKETSIVLGVGQVAPQQRGGTRSEHFVRVRRAASAWTGR